MNPRSPYRSRTDLSPEELQKFLRRTHQLPAVRVAKVVAVREALRHDRYDLEEGLDTTAARLAAELLDWDVTDK